VNALERLACLIDDRAADNAARANAVGRTFARTINTLSTQRHAGDRAIGLVNRQPAQRNTDGIELRVDLKVRRPRLVARTNIDCAIRDQRGLNAVER